MESKEYKYAIDRPPAVLLTGDCQGLHYGNMKNSIHFVQIRPKLSYHVEK